MLSRSAIQKMGFLGGGKMAEAIITGMMDKKIIDKDRVVVADPNAERRKEFSNMGVHAVYENKGAMKDADVVVLAIKPQTIDKVLQEMTGNISNSALVISIVAGVPMNVIVDGLGENARVVRTMPNTPSMIGQGITVWTKSTAVSEQQHALAETVLGSFGEEVYVDDENNLDMATALSGSGPAYFFLVAEAMVDAGVHMGFPRHVAMKLVQQTMLGSALYMKASEKDPVSLRNDITSPGGTTAAALYRAEKNGFRADIGDAIWAAYERCLEIAAPYPVQRKRPRS